MSFRADGADDEDIPDPPVESPPLAATSPRPEFSKAVALTNAALMWERQLGTKGRQLAHSPVEGHPLAGRQSVSLMLCLDKPSNLPHLGRPYHAWYCRSVALVGETSDPWHHAR